MSGPLYYLARYYAAYYGQKGFILRDGTQLKPPNITGTAIPENLIIGSETVLLEFLADYLLQTPVAWDGSKVYYPSGKDTAPTAIILVDRYKVVEDNNPCGLSAVKAKAISFLGNAGSDETIKLAAPILESIGSVNLSAVFLGANFSIGTATTLQDMAKTFIEVVVRRAIYALGTDVFLRANTQDLNSFLAFIVKVVSDDANAPGTSNEIGAGATQAQSPAPQRSRPST